MKTGLSRRGLIGLVPSALLVPSAALGSRTQAGSVHPLYPSHHPDAVKEIVSMSHGNLERVREMLKVTPALAKSAWEWGFGDWETPLAAAAHTGQAEIARLLMENGAQPDVFAFAMLGNLDAVQMLVKQNPGIQRSLGPHGITLLAHARFGGEKAAGVLAYLTELGDAGSAAVNLPLSDTEKEVYVGKYVFGEGANDHFVVALSKAKALQIQRPTGVNRMLNRVEDHGFAPTGAPHARIRFTVEGGVAVSLSVHDLQPVLVAKR